jgi:hypothetical protein
VLKHEQLPRKQVTCFPQPTRRPVEIKDNPSPVESSVFRHADQPHLKTRFPPSRFSFHSPGALPCADRAEQDAHAPPRSESCLFCALPGTGFLKQASTLQPDLPIFGPGFHFSSPYGYSCYLKTYLIQGSKAEVPGVSRHLRSTA